jgi:WD40 repeat protein
MLPVKNLIKFTIYLLLLCFPLIGISQEVKLGIPVGHLNVTFATFSPDEKYLLTASSDATAKIWEVSTGRLIHTLEGHKRGIISAIYSSDGKFIITHSHDNTLRIWDVYSGFETKRFSFNTQIKE